jgi:hypothetical protein
MRNLVVSSNLESNASHFLKKYSHIEYGVFNIFSRQIEKKIDE